MKPLRECPRCNEAPGRSSAPDSTSMPDPDDTTYFLACQCEYGVSGASPGACVAAWDARCDEVAAELDPDFNPTTGRSEPRGSIETDGVA